MEQEKALTSTITSFDEIFSAIGVSRYQILVFLAIGLSNVQQGAFAIGSVFLQAVPEFECEDPGDLFIKNNTCNVEYIDNCRLQDGSSCKNFKFSKETFTSTVATEFELVCSRSYINTFITLCYFFGFFIGAFSGGLLSDNFGRMQAAIIGHVGTIITSIIASYSTSWQMFAIFRMLSGIFSHIPWIAGFVMIMESVPQK